MDNSEAALADAGNAYREFLKTMRSPPSPSSTATLLQENPEQAHNSGMTSLPREEFNARLEATEARMDARVVSIEGKIDGMMIRMDEREKRLDERFTSIQSDVATMKTDMVNNSRSLKYWLVGTAIATVIALYSANIAMVQTMFGAFESGKSTAAAITQATEQMKQTQDHLKAIEERLAKQAAPQK